MRFWNMIPDADAPGDGVLDIEGPITDEVFFGNETSSKEFRKALNGIGNVTVHINSPGGDVMAGAEIYSALREHSMNGQGRVKVIITALAASAASVVAMAGDEILISPVAYLMIHNPWTMTAGDAKDLRKTAKTLDEIAEGLITAYQRKTGKTRDELKKMLDNETWMSATRAVEEGFCDGVYGGELRAAACVPSTMTRATPETIAEMCRRWEKMHGEADPEKPDEDDPEEPEEETEPDGEADPDEDPENPNDPDGDGPEDPEREEDAAADQLIRAGDPAEDDPENPNDPDGEKARKQDIARRANAVADAMLRILGNL